MFSRKIVLALVTLALVGGVGCGNKNNPAPPPPPQISNPNPNGGGFVGGGSCGGVAGQPLNNGLPFQSTLSGGYGMSNNSMSLTLAYPATGGYGQTTALVGSAQMTLPDLQQMFQMYVQQYSFCVSSVDPASGALNTGSLIQGSYVNLSLAGIIQVPNSSYAPPGYPGTQQLTPMPVYVDIGQGSCAYIQNNRLIGCVYVSFGTRGQNSIPYQADGNGGYSGGGYGGGGYSPYQGGYGYGGNSGYFPGLY